MTELQLKKNKQTAATVSVALFGVLFIVMWFLVVFVPQNPPIGFGSGVNLNLGFADEGSGDIQPDEIGNDGTSDEPTVKSEAQSPPPQETEQTPVQEEKSEAKTEVSDLSSESQEESPVVVPPTKKEEVKKTAEKAPVDKPKEKQPEVKQQVNPTAVYDPNAKKSSTAATTGAGKTGQGGNEGDDKGKTGDKGDPRGVKEGTVYEGNPGQGGPGPGGIGGFGLAMSGWAWDETPNKPKVDDNESGFVVFEVKVDENGDIKSCIPKEYTLSIETVNRCKAKIMERSFVRTAGTTAPPQTIGIVRFELKVR
jgi:outer membrane biosynthesis protein TonB